MAATLFGIEKTTLNYFLEPKDGGSTDVYVNVKDIRGREDDFTLDKHGFQLVKRQFTEKTFDDEKRIEEQYYHEIAQLLKDVTGASTVVVGAHVVRRQSWESVFEAEKDMPDEARSLGPSNAKFVHCDQSYDGARARTAVRHPEHADKLDKCRWATINVWKPFDYPVTRDALCFADAFSIRDDELRPVNLRFPARRDSVHESGGEAQKQQAEAEAPAQPDYYSATDSATGITLPAVEAWQCAPPTHPDQHKWYYASEMKPDEALLLKIADSKRSVANKLMHTSFSREHDYGPERHSLEVRCTVFWEDQPVN